MNISNPKTTIGGLPLATTWYVNTRFEGTKKYIDIVSAFLSGYTDQEVTAATNAAIGREAALSAEFIERDAALSATSDKNDGQIIEAFCRYITGTTREDIPSNFVNSYLTGFVTPHEDGYAWLGPDGKVADELMPDISLMDITVVDVKQIFQTLSGKGLLESTSTDGFYAAAFNAGQVVSAVVPVLKSMLQKYVLIQEEDAGQAPFSAGDILVVTYYDDENKTFANSLNSEARLAFKNVFSQSFIAGGWICNKELRDQHNKQKNTSITFTKLSFNQGEIISVNDLAPTANGNVAINLANIHKINSDGQTSKNKIGETLAKDLQQVRSLQSDPTAINTVNTEEGLVQNLDFTYRFVYSDRIYSAGYSYTTLNEFASLNIKAKEVTDFISAALDAENDRAIRDEQIISAALTGEIKRSTDYDTYLSGVIGTEADLRDVTVTSALLALKNYANITKSDINQLADEINTTDYDLLDVYTVVIPAGQVQTVETQLPNGIHINAVNYAQTHQIDGFTTLYESNIYNYFGFAPKGENYDIAEITIGGFTGKILDIYVQPDPAVSSFIKLDTDIQYQETPADNFGTAINAKFTLLGEYYKGPNPNQPNNPDTTVIDKIIVRYTKKHTYNPTAFNPDQFLTD